LLACLLACVHAASISPACSAMQARHIPPQTIDFIRRGPVLDVRFSLDKRHVCIQRSSADVDFVSLQDATEVAYQCREKGKGNMIHGFVWCNTALCDMCLVTEMGLELVKLAPKLEGVKLVKHERRSVNWFQYYHPCRTLLLWYVYLYSTLKQPD